MLFKEATTYVCVCIYISRTREKKEIVLFLGSLSPPLPFSGVRILQPRVSLHFIDPLYLYRIPVSTIPASSLLRDSRNPSSRNNKIVHRDISLYDKHSSLSLSLSFDPRRGHRFSPFSFSPLPDPWIEDLSSKGKIQSCLSVSLSRSIYRGSSGRSRSSPIHARFEGRSGWRVLDLVGGERSGRERNAKGRRGAREGYARRGSLEK